MLDMFDIIIISYKPVYFHNMFVIFLSVNLH